MPVELTPSLNINLAEGGAGMRLPMVFAWPIAATLGGLFLGGPVSAAEPAAQPSQVAPSAAARLAEADRLIDEGRRLRREPGKAGEAEALAARARARSCSRG